MINIKKTYTATLPDGSTIERRIEPVYLPSDIVIRVDTITDISGVKLDLETSHYDFKFFIENNANKYIVISYDGVNRVNSVYDGTSKTLLLIIKGITDGQPTFKGVGALKYQQRDTFDSDVVGDCIVRYSEFDSGITIKRLTSGSK